jgi:hypothetical protein
MNCFGKFGKPETVEQAIRQLYYWVWSGEDEHGAMFIAKNEENSEEFFLDNLPRMVRYLFVNNISNGYWPEILRQLIIKDVTAEDFDKTVKEYFGEQYV